MLDENKLAEYCTDSSGNLVKGMIHCLSYDDLYDTLSAALQVVRAVKEDRVIQPYLSQELVDALAPFSEEK